MLPLLRHIFPSRAGGTWAAALDFLAARSGFILCALFLLAGLILAGDYGIEIDGPHQRGAAQANLDYILGRADRIATPVYLDRVFGMAFALPLLLTEKALGLEDYYHIHRLYALLTHLFFILGAFCCYRLAYHLFGSRLIALVALLFYLLHPRIYAQSFFSPRDLPFLSMFSIALYLLERAFRRDTLAAFALLGIAVALLTNLRIMGIMLLAAPLALRGLDWGRAPPGPERKHILRTAGLFALTAGLTLYALSPYAWTNPVDYLASTLKLTVNHPNISPQLFQGQRPLSSELPPHYTAVWFGITTPPLILLLGLGGAAGVAIRGLIRPGAALGNTRLRFQLLLLACFLLPPLAAALLGSVQHGNWRHFYYLYVPFGLLAAGGLHWLTAGLTRQPAWPAGMYGLAGLGLGLVLLQMAQLHPLQNDYFNFLVDRTTPEYLRTQYPINYYRLAHREGLAYLLERYPEETLSVRADLRQYNTLSPAARRRLPPATVGRGADYDLIYPPDPRQPELAFNGEYRRRIYNNTMVAVRPLDAARMTPAAVAAYRELYRQAVAGEPIIRADYTVYRHGRRLTFVQENCPPDGGDVWFGVRFFPHYPEILPPHKHNSGSYVTFQTNRVKLGMLCLAVLQLPEYAQQGDIILMQRDLGRYRPEGLPAWEELYSLAQPGLGELIAEYRRGKAAAAPPLIPNSVAGPAAAFDVFIDQADGRNRLIYAKGDCTAAEYETPVTLHITPVDLADLPDYRRGSGFDNRDFPIDWYGGRPGGDCIAVAPLPDYPIAAIGTGQADLWEVNLYPLTEPDYLRAAYAALTEGQPDYRGVFDFYWREGRLVYLRESCAAADTAAGFFLHIIPVDAADLPAEQRDVGFANWDFAFARWGGHFDGKCMAVVALPDYPIAVVRTGQYGAEQGGLGWVVGAGGR